MLCLLSAILLLWENSSNVSVDIGVCLPYCGCGKTVAVCCDSGYWGLSAVLLLWENSSSVLCQWILGFVCRIAVVGKQ